MTIKKTWQKSDNNFFLRDVSTEQKELFPGIYTLELSMTGFYLKQLGTKFEFSYKIYGLETDFIKRVVKYYNNSKDNVGILLNGYKGTGKTVTAEVLSNELSLPVILINQNFSGANSYLASIQQELVVFIDEYEKVFDGKVSLGDEEEEDVPTGDHSFLSLMDGTLKTKFRKVFILTTNRTWINENLLSRPGRIRYLKQFSDLSKPQIEEIVDDILIHKQFRNDLVDYFKPLKLITVDIVKSVTNEVNIFKEPALICCKHFNLEFKEDVYNIVKLGTKDVIIENDVRAIYVERFVESCKRSWKGTRLNTENINYKVFAAPVKGIYTVYDEYSVRTDKVTAKNCFKIRLDKVKYTHSSYVF